MENFIRNNVDCMGKIKIYGILMLVVALLCSCSKDETEVPQETAEYKITLYNNIGRTGGNYNYQGVLYDICLISSNGEVYGLGDLPYGEKVTWSLPQSHDSKDVMILALKIAGSKQEAQNSYFMSPEAVEGKPYPIYVQDGVTKGFMFYENMKWLSMKVKTLDELKGYFNQ